MIAMYNDSERGYLMRWFYKFKQKCEKNTIPNLAMFITFCMAAGLILVLREDGINLYLRYLAFIPSEVLRGQIWRIFSAIIFPPALNSIFFMALSIFFFYSFATDVERGMGQFEFNVYFFGSLLIGEIGCLIGYWVTGFDNVFSPAFAVFSVFMAYAILYPENQIMIMYILPVKAKYAGLMEAGIYIYMFITGDLYSRIYVAAALLPVIIFYMIAHRDDYIGGNPISNLKFRMNQKKRQKEWEDNFKA